MENYGYLLLYALFTAGELGVFVLVMNYKRASRAYSAPELRDKMK